MTKTDIAIKLSNRMDIHKSVAIQAADEITNILSEAFAAGENIYLRGFGTFEVVNKKAKKARDISRGTEILVPAHKSVKFRISNDLKKRMNS